MLQSFKNWDHCNQPVSDCVSSRNMVEEKKHAYSFQPCPNLKLEKMSANIFRKHAGRLIKYFYRCLISTWNSAFTVVNNTSHRYKWNHTHNTVRSTLAYTPLREVSISFSLRHQPATPTLLYSCHYPLFWDNCSTIQDAFQTIHSNVVTNVQSTMTRINLCFTVHKVAENNYFLDRESVHQKTTVLRNSPFDCPVTSAPAEFLTYHSYLMMLYRLQTLCCAKCVPRKCVNEELRRRCLIKMGY